MNADTPNSAVQPHTITAVQRLDRLPVTPVQIFWVSLLGLGFLIENFDNGVFALLAPAIRDEWGLSLGRIGLITSAVFLGMFVGAVGGGRLSDRYGRKPVLIWSSVFYSAASLMSALAPNFEVLLASRVLTGIGVQATSGAIMVYLSEMFPSASRGRFFSVVTFCGYAASPIASLVALAIVPTGEGAWRWVFALGAVGVVIAVAVAAALPESVRWLVSHGKTEEADVIVDRLEARAGGLGPLEPALPVPPSAPTNSFRDLLRPEYARRLAVLGISFAITLFCMYGFISWAPTILVDRGLSQSQALAITTAVGLGSLISPLLLFPVVDRIERKTTILVAGSVAGIGMMIFGSAHDALLSTVAGVIVAVGITAMTTSFYTYLPEVFPTAVRGAGAGMINGFGRIAGFASGITVAAVYSSQGSATLYFLLGSGLVVMGVLTAALGPRTTNRSLEVSSGTSPK